MWSFGSQQDCIVVNHGDIVEAIMFRQMASCCGTCGGCVKRLGEARIIARHRRNNFGDPFMVDNRVTWFRFFVLLLHLLIIIVANYLVVLIGDLLRGCW